MTDWKEWFELWTLHTPDMRLKMVKNATFIEYLYENLKARMIAEQQPQQFSLAQELMRQGEDQVTAQSAFLGENL